MKILAHAGKVSALLMIGDTLYPSSTSTFSSRLYIYELAFAPEHEPGDEVDLFTGKAPSKSLLLTCQRINSEAHGIYTSAYRRFWTETNLVACQRILKKKLPDKKGHEKVRTMPRPKCWRQGKLISTTSQLTVHVAPNVFVLVDPRGIWHHMHFVPDKGSFAPVLYPTPYEFSRYTRGADGTAGDPQ